MGQLRAQSDLDLVTPWSATDGQVYELTSAQVLAISDAVADHVAACFAVYAGVIALIEAGEITEPAEVEAAFAG